MINRKRLAEIFADGLGGWFQLQASQELHRSSGEDSARTIVAQIANARPDFIPRTSQLPNNWGTTKKRIDVALCARSELTKTWYGAIELKWPGDAFVADDIRLNSVQDVLRLCFVETTNLNARFFIMGGTTKAIDILFDKEHPRAVDSENRRLAFNQLLSRDLETPKGNLTTNELKQSFHGYEKRLPETVFGSFDGKLKTKLIASHVGCIGSIDCGAIYVWNCTRTRGTAG